MALTEKFWRIAIKWWFLPSFHGFLALVFSIAMTFFSIVVSQGNLSFILGFPAIYFLMPGGLFYFAYLFTHYNKVADYVPILSFLFHILMIVSIFVIRYYYRNKNLILKWLIITIMLISLLSFMGCSLGVFTKTPYILTGGL